MLGWTFLEEPAVLIEQFLENKQGKYETGSTDCPDL